MQTKSPRVIIDFGDELARQLSSERVAAIIADFIQTEASIDIRAAATILGLCERETRKHARKWPVLEFGIGARGNRYRLKDILSYRDKHLTQPKH